MRHQGLLSQLLDRRIQLNGGNPDGGGRWHLSDRGNLELVKGKEPLQQLILYYGRRLRCPGIVPSNEREVRRTLPGSGKEAQTLRLLDRLLRSILSSHLLQGPVPRLGDDDW